METTSPYDTSTRNGYYSTWPMRYCRQHCTAFGLCIDGMNSYVLSPKHTRKSTPTLSWQKKHFVIPHRATKRESGLRSSNPVKARPRLNPTSYGDPQIALENTRKLTTLLFSHHDHFHATDNRRSTTLLNTKTLTDGELGLHGVFQSLVRQGRRDGVRRARAGRAAPRHALRVGAGGAAADAGCRGGEVLIAPAVPRVLG